MKAGPHDQPLPTAIDNSSFIELTQILEGFFWGGVKLERLGGLGKQS